MGGFSPSRVRTGDLAVNSHTLYQLSYRRSAHLPHQKNNHNSQHIQTTTTNTHEPQHNTYTHITAQHNHIHAIHHSISTHTPPHHHQIINHCLITPLPLSPNSRLHSQLPTNSPAQTRTTTHSRTRHTSAQPSGDGESSFSLAPYLLFVVCADWVYLSVVCDLTRL
jgi:hypothetical protein